MIFKNKSSSKPYWSFSTNIKLILKHLYLKKEFYIKILIYFQINVFYFNQFLHNLSN